MTEKKKTKPQWREVKIELENKSHKNLLKLLKLLYDRSENNENFIKANVFQERVTIQSYKNAITTAIYLDTNDRNDKIEFSKAKKAISDFRQANGDVESVLDLMIHYVEVGTEQTNGICIDYCGYYDSLESMFRSIIKYLTDKDKDFVNFFCPRLEGIINNSSNAGYGYQETIQEMFDDAFPRLKH